MICPYNHKKIEQVEQDTYEYDVEGRTTMREHKLIETREYGECYNEECGAYRDGRCMYNITAIEAESDT